MRNEEWVNPHGPDAKVGPTKEAGATDMIYKPEHTVDLDTGAILQAEVRLGHLEADQKDLSRHRPRKLKRISIRRRIRLPTA